MWHERWNHPADLVRPALPGTYGAQVSTLVQLASFSLIGPVLTWLAHRLVLLSGEPTISNYAIARFLPTPEGMGSMALLLVLMSATLFAEFAGLRMPVGDGRCSWVTLGRVPKRKRTFHRAHPEFGRR
jgi:hypothetical protein